MSINTFEPGTTVHGDQSCNGEIIEQFVDELTGGQLDNEHVHFGLNKGDRVLAHVSSARESP